MYMSKSKKGNRKIKSDFFRVMRMWEFLILIFLIFVIAVMLSVPLKTVVIHHVNEPYQWLSSTLLPSSPIKSLLLQSMVCPQEGGQAGEAGSAEDGVSGSVRRPQRTSLCFSRDKTLYFFENFSFRDHISLP